ncbi:hypothetical protein H7142_00960 [Candidatus Saccharibacteria bacterium]|nr:hypothetical protein [Candidatus Saccharibacteria bacterium]
MALKVKKKYPVARTSQYHTLPQRTHKREQRQKSTRRLITMLFTLCIMTIGAGLVYTWYSGQQKIASADQPAPARPTRTILKPHKIASDAPIGAAVQTLTSEVKPGDNASITIRTNPEAECTITVKYDTVAAVDSGLVPKLSDEFGVVGWSWTVAPGTAQGVWPAEVLCKNKKNSAMVRGDIKVTNTPTN